MAFGVGIEAPTTHEAPLIEARADTRLERLSLVALMLLPGALIVFTGFRAGGNFPATPAIAALVVSQILLVRIMQARRPFEGLAPVTLVAIAALALYAALTLLSATWSHSKGTALIEFDRAWLYLLLLVLFGSVRASPGNLRWLIRGIVLGAAVVCLAGLVSRVLPDVLHTSPGVANQRLSYPVTYWNALGLLAAVGALFALHLACDLDELRPVRALAAALVPLLTVTLFFTFSRGAIAAGAIGLVLYLLLARPGGLLGGLLSTVPATVALLLVAYDANLLDTPDPTTPAAVAQGHRVALAAALCALACGLLRLLLPARLDAIVPRIRRRVRLSREAKLAGAAVLLAVVIISIPALGVPHNISHEWNRFLSGAPTSGNAADFRQRLTDVSNDQRTPLWRAALAEFSASPLHGSGAGMFHTVWEQRRPTFQVTVNAHSLYLQAMAELGVPGVTLIVLCIGACLIGLVRRLRGRERALVGAIFAASVAWAVHAGVDWDWEMPVVTLSFFAAAGLALSPRLPGGRGWVPGLGARVALALACLAGAVVPVLIIGSQERLIKAEHAFQARDCRESTSAALSAIAWLDVMPEPYELVGFCDLRRGSAIGAVSAMSAAVSQDPHSWEPHYALAIADAAAGIDPRPAAALAHRLNPLEPLTGQAVSAFATNKRAQWVRRAPQVLVAALASYDLSIVPS